MSRLRYLLIGLLLIAMALPVCAGKDTLYQISTIDALMSGIYDGKVTFKELAKHGDTGIGTFNTLDGEMIGLDGKFYQITSDGACHPVSDSMMTPFAAVTFFDKDTIVPVDRERNFADLREYVDSLLPSKNLFYAVRIEGTFKSVKTRSVPKQQKPYPKLIDVVAKQPTFELTDVKGTIIGFWCPYFVKGVNVPGYHLHFIDEAKTKGGHVLDCVVKSGMVFLDITPEFRLSLPVDDEFEDANLDPETSKDLEAVEGGNSTADEHR